MEARDGRSPDRAQEPEDETFRRGTGERTARRNLWFSVLSEHVGFSVWSLWSVMVLFTGPGLTWAVYLRGVAAVPARPQLGAVP
ncbi:hypothetical protein GTW44_07350 [Streptomyces sp. SID8360]|nr:MULTISPECIES: hypothetical protein [unclassified Streptomyces]AEN10325.1 hypothetical protein SACTE_2437 [Streptomyces sp. SirexAA-E]MYR65004.1 hypothetical protein [Streptomyces sp. SID4939]MYT65476.1 hypothetical protein [Streptomyces sp. SID8357]MYT84531.1 hypothetical protein [Streptomyces sp. SID8360]MYU37126.1 hypothetical protein [Streptomyces sp. SID8358]MYW37797.1 hypothetical protein [Streptomyces sp. SID1]PZX33584.1 hypothetical protein K373_05282 [Streptomyces sp. DvalAA-21]R